MNQIEKKEYIYSTEPNTGVQRIFAFKPYPIAIDSYEIYIRYSELEEYLKLFWEYIIHKNNITLDNNDANSSYYDATHPALQPYKKYIPQIKQKYWEHLKENVWLESYTDLYEVKPAEF